MMHQCTLCPRNCKIDRTKTDGFCGATDKIKLARAGLHFWEEPCISGIFGSGTVFFSGCNLKCVYCQNKEISKNNFGKEISVNRLAEIFLELQQQKAHNINLVTPTHFVPQIIEALKIAKLNIPVVYNTGGYETVETIKMLKGYVDIYLTDVKYFSEINAVKYSNAPNYFENAVNALAEMISQQPSASFDGDIMKSGVIVRHLILPSNKNDTINILKALKDKFGTDKFLLSLMSQYTPYEKYDNPELNRKITSLEYKHCINEALNLGFNGFMQEKSSAKQEYTPPFDLSGI